jgi:hypothetical protein
VTAGLAPRQARRRLCRLRPGPSRHPGCYQLPFRCHGHLSRWAAARRRRPRTG